MSTEKSARKSDPAGKRIKKMAFLSRAIVVKNQGFEGAKVSTQNLGSVENLFPAGRF